MLDASFHPGRQQQTRNYHGQEALLRGQVTPRGRSRALEEPGVRQALPGTRWVQGGGLRSHPAQKASCLGTEITPRAWAAGCAASQKTTTPSAFFFFFFKTDYPP